MTTSTKTEINDQTTGARQLLNALQEETDGRSCLVNATVARQGVDHGYDSARGAVTQVGAGVVMGAAFLFTLLCGFVTML